jgi:hypothetical protein
MKALEVHSTNPYVFIVGCPRSGTTLLQRIVNAHPQIAILSESHWIPRLFEKRAGLTPEGMVSAELIARLLEQPEFPRLQISQEEIEGLIGNSQPMSYSSFIESLFNFYGRAQGKALVGNKTPGFVRRLPIMHELWPKARFVHLIRDGRDTYLSTVNRPLRNPKPGVFDTWEEDHVSTAALWWELNLQLGRQASSWLGPELYYEIRYESLINHPAEECGALCAFLGLPYDEAMLRFYEGQTKPRAARPITPGLRDWQSQMPVEDVEKFEAIAGDLLDELGYRRAFPRLNPEISQRASGMRDLFTRNPRNRVLVRDLAQTADLGEMDAD